MSADSKLGAGRFAVAHQGLHRRLYQRLGPRYPRFDVLAVLALLQLVALGGMAATTLYLEISGAEFLRLMIASQALFAAVSLVAWRVARRKLGPVETWLHDKRTADPEAAWRAAAELPFGLPHSAQLLGAALLACIAWDAYAAAELDLGAPAALALFGGSAVTFLYWTMLAFFSIEHGMRPVLSDIAASLPGDPPPAGRRIPLRLRLGTAVPAINVVTGVLVAGFFPGAGGARDLAIGLGAALAVSGSVSLWLTNLLTDSVVTPIATLREAANRIGRGELDVRVAVGTDDESADLARAFNGMVEGLKRRDRLRDAFGAYVDPDLARRIEEGAIDLSGQDLVATIVFVDVRGFTGFAERAEAREVVFRLNQLFERVVPIVLEHGGHANKFIGDGLMAVFGAPDPRPDHAEEALRAAVEIARAAGGGSAEELSVGVGVNSGEVVAGTLGGGGRLDFTVIGDAVNTAARVEAATRRTGDPVLATEATLDLVGPQIRQDWVERESMPLKGKADPIRLFAPRLSDRADGSSR